MRRTCDSLPEDVLCVVFSFLPVRDLVHCACVCKQWESASQMDCLWKSYCNLLWKNKANVTLGELYYRSLLDYNLLTLQEMQRMLQSRDVSSSFSSNNPQDLVRQLHASEMLMEEMSTNFTLRFSRSKWKASYAYSIVDCAQRQYITPRELTNNQWVFMFKHQPYHFHATAQFIPPSHFGGGGRLILQPSPVHFNLNWRLTNQNLVQILNFPSHRISRRTEDWAFAIENRDVIFLQTNFPAFNLERERTRILANFPDYAFFNEGW